MSTFEGALRTRLVTYPAAAAEAGDRVSWVMRPQQDPLPAFVMQLISAPVGQTMDGFETARRARVQVDAWSRSHAQAVRMRDAAIAALIPAAEAGGIRFQRAFVSVREGGEPTDEGFAFRQLMDFLFTYSEAA